MVCLSIHPDCWIEIQILLFASKVLKNRISPSIYYQSRKNIYQKDLFINIKYIKKKKLHYIKNHILLS